MAWVAFDRAVKAVSVDPTLLTMDVDQLRALRDEVHADVLAHGYDAERGSFVQTYGSAALDASLLMIPLVGFLPPDDQGAGHGGGHRTRVDAARLRAPLRDGRRRRRAATG